jgi:microcystin-dependent protein
MSFVGLSPRLRNLVRRSSRRRYPAIVALAVSGAALWASGQALATSLPSAAAPSYLFSIPSAAGSLRGPSDQHLTLRLTGARRYLTRFTDAPLRQAAVVANVDFARRFATYFASADPNAVLTYTPSGAQIPVSIVLTVEQPRWNARHATWTFPATRIRKTTDNLPGTTVHITPPLIPNPRSFKHATLLIDDAADSGYCTRGDIDYFPSAIIPTLLERSYEPARGQEIPIAQFEAVYAVIGTNFGGDGEEYFRLPNLPDVGNLVPYFCMSGNQPTQEGVMPAQCLAGNVELTAETEFVPNGWLPAKGWNEQIAEYPALYSQIGTTFGGDGSQFFTLPKLNAPPGFQNIICADGAGWDPSANSPYPCTVGELDLFATSSLPQFELPADGRLFQIGDAPELFADLGTAFGGDGNETFGLPDPPVPLKGTSWGICGQGAEPAPW